MVVNYVLEHYKLNNKYRINYEGIRSSFILFELKCGK
jgi:hypothetical protein